jgi:hypothetical protein
VAFSAFYLNLSAALFDSLEPVPLLTTPSSHCLDNLSNEFATTGTEAYAKFLKNLNVISEEITPGTRRLRKPTKLRTIT